MKIGERLKQIIGVAAPTIGTALGGPLGGLAGSFVSKALGVDDEDAAVAKLNTDPQALVSLRQAELDFKKHLDDNGIDLERIAAGDRADARGLAKAAGVAPQVALSTLFIVGYFVILGLFFSKTVEVPMSAAFMVMLGVLTAGVTQILNFWLGSSRGSQAKDDAIATIAATP